MPSAHRLAGACTSSMSLVNKSVVMRLCNSCKGQVALHEGGQHGTHSVKENEGYQMDSSCCCKALCNEEHCSFMLFPISFVNAGSI